MNAIAVSLYDKFDDLAVLVDIIRANWEEEYFISVCSNHPDAKQEIDKLDIDFFVQGEEITYAPDMNGRRAAINLNCRIIDSIRKACTGAMDAGCKYVMHVHADAWPLKEETFLEMADHLAETEKSLALRGYDPTYRRPGLWMGYPMDQFFLFDAGHFRNVSFFDFNLMDLFPFTSVHNMLALLVHGKVGMSNVYAYSDFSDDTYWDGRPIVRPFGSPRSGLVNERWGLLHIPPDEFPEDYGRQIQAHFLREYGLTNGRTISSFLYEYDAPLQEVMADLYEIERKQDRKLKLLGFSPGQFGRQFRTKQRILDEPLSEKARLLVENVMSKSYHGLMRLVWDLSPFENTQYDGRLQTRHLYRDSEWPDETIESVLEEAVCKDDFPPGTAQFWFDE